jgi:hypothetical protein
MLETGAVWQYRNDVRIDPKTGDTLEFDEFQDSPSLHYRLEYHLNLNRKHALRLIYAPYKVQVEGKVSKDIRFKEETFSKNKNIKVNYKFNSYRLGYKYLFSKSFNFGLTLKIRDAEISLEQDDKKESYDNIGLVPLFYFSYFKHLTDRCYIYTDIDFAAAPQGRAIDLAVKLRRSLTRRSDVGIGVRSLEGGAENDKVYTFSWLNYLIVDYKYSF